MGTDRAAVDGEGFESGREIRQELIKYIGSEYNGVIAADLTSGDSGARKVDSALGPSHRGLGRRAATPVFLYSFSGGHERGATLEEIKRMATTLENPASVVAEAAELMKNKLFYLQSVDDKFFFDNVPNLNLIRITRMENIKAAELVDLEEEALKARIRGEKLKVFLWEGKWLGPDEQKKQIRLEIKKISKEVKEAVRRLYQVVTIPTQGGFKEDVLGDPTYGEERPIDEEVFEWLRAKEEILLKIAPLAIKERYLSGRESISIEQIYRSSLQTPGEVRVVDPSVLEDGITGGVRQGLFGLGELEDSRPVCRYFKEEPFVALSGNEVLIVEELCRKQPPGVISEIAARPGDRSVTIQWKEVGEATSYNIYWSEKPGFDRGSGTQIVEARSPYTVDGLKNKKTYYFAVAAENAFGESDLSVEVSAKPGSEVEVPGPEPGIRERIHLKFRVPKGKVAGIMGVMNLLQSKFENLSIEIEATDGEITDPDYEDKIKEAFRQLGVEVEE